MSQTYTTAPYAGGAVVATTMTAVNNNFAALKSAFSGAAAPANTVAGQWWYDTTAHILKVRNEADTAWLSVWDLANNKPVIANLSNEITLGMMAASAKSPAAGTEGLRKLGTGALDAMPGNTSLVPPNGSVSTAKIQNGAVTAAKLTAPTAALTTLITRIRETELTVAGGGTAVVGAAVVLNDGAFRLYTQLKSSTSGTTRFNIYVNGTFLIALTTYIVSYTAKTYNLTGMSAGDKIYCTLGQTFSGTGYCRYVRLYSGTSAPASAVCIYPYDTY